MEIERRHFDRTTEAVKWSYEQQAKDRDIHLRLVRHLLGAFYPASDGMGGMQTAIPLASMAVRAMGRALISKSPRMLVNTDDPSRKSWAETAEIQGNKRLITINADQVLREVAGQSFVSFGTLFLAPVYVGTPTGMKLELGVEAIDRADYVYDTDSTSLETPDYEGHKFRMKVVDVHEHPLFSEEKVDVRPDTNDQIIQDTSSVKIGGGRIPLYEHVEIWCAYDRPRNKLVYYPRHTPSIKLLESEWTGPRHGPYRKLYYEKPPGNAVPISPLMHLITTHEAHNILAMRGIHQEQVAKGLLTYNTASEADAERMVNSNNCQSVLQENGAVGWKRIGGASPSTVAMAEKLRQDFSYASSGIVDQFLQQADTLGQERLTRGSSNDTVDDMAGYAYRFVKGLVNDVFWFDIRDPDQHAQQVRKPINGTELSYLTSWTPEHRRAVIDMEFDVDVEPYSYVERSPDNRLADILGALEIFERMADQAVAQGVTLDVEAVMRVVAKYKNLPEIYDCLHLNQDPERLQQLLGARPQTGQQDSGPKRYIRESRSDGSGERLETMRMFGRQEQEAVA